MSDWVFSLGLLIVLFTVLSLLIPEGKTSKVVKLTFSSVIMLLLLKPMFNIRNGDLFDLSFSDGNNYISQENYLEFVNRQKITIYQSNCEQITKELGINDAFVTIEYSVDEKYQIKIETVLVYVQLTNEYLEKEQEINEQITSKLSSYLNVSKSIVKVYGKQK